MIKMIHFGGNISMWIGQELKITECRQFRTVNGFLMFILQLKLFPTVLCQKLKSMIKIKCKYSEKSPYSNIQKKHKETKNIKRNWCTTNKQEKKCSKLRLLETILNLFTTILNYVFLYIYNCNYELWQDSVYRKQ